MITPKELAITLQSHGATYEHPGYVSIPTSGGELCIGTANGCWGADMIEPGGYVRGVESKLPLDAPAGEVIKWARYLIE